MLSKATWFKTILGIFLSVLLAFYMYQFLTELSQQTEVIVALQEIPAQTVVLDQMVKRIQIHAKDKEKLAPGAISRIEDVIGKITREQIKKGEIISTNTTQLLIKSENGYVNLANDGHVPDSYFIPPDMRAISIRVDAEGSLGFGVNAGDEVDILYTSLSYETGGIYSRLLLSKVPIYKVDEVSSRDRQSGSNAVMQNITLLVSPDDAQVVALAKRKGKLDLMFRPISPDTQKWDTGKMTRVDVLALPK